PWINELKRWAEWSAWTEARYPAMKTTYAGPASGTGASMSWEGKKSGQGTLQITSSDPAKGLIYDLDFEHGAYRSKGTITFQRVDSGNSLVVTWSNAGSLGWNPVSRYFGLFMDSMMGPDMEAGLKSLQTKVEAK